MKWANITMHFIVLENDNAACPTNGVYVINCGLRNQTAFFIFVHS